MRWAFYLLFLAPFWETKPAADWSAAEVQQMFRTSPWAQAAVPQSDTGGEKDVFVYLGAARPMRDAEEQRWRQGKKEPHTGADEDKTWVDAHTGKENVLT